MGRLAQTLGVSNFMFSRSPSAEDILCESQYGIPPERARRRMSPLQLADILATATLNKTARILIEHELNIRIAQVQSRAAYNASAIAIGGIAFGWFLNQLTPPQATVVTCSYQGGAESIAKKSSANPTPPVPIIAKEVQPAPKAGATQGNGANAKP